MRSWVTIRGKLFFLVVASIAVMPLSALALTASQVYEQVKDSVVVVKAFNQQGRLVGLASGVMLPSGNVITNYHVIKPRVRYMVGQGKKGVPATVIASNRDKDICLLSAPGLTAKPAHLGQAAKLKVGEPVYAVGAPQGLELSLSEGIVSQLRGGPPPIIQTTVAISRGSSGGGLFNANGELVGITTFYLKDSQSLNFALPVEWIGEPAGGEIQTRPRAEVPRKAAEPAAQPKEGWQDRAQALSKVQDWQALVAHCRQWTKNEPGSEVAWGTLGLAYGKVGSYRESIEANREAVRLKPGSSKAWNDLGVAFAQLGRAHDAVRAYREAVRLKPDNTQAWYNLALAFAKAGNRGAALEAAKELRRVDPDRADKLLNLINKQ
jgi:hypothetical protein